MRRLVWTIVFGMAFLLNFAGCQNTLEYYDLAAEEGSFTDSRDGQTYRTIKIGNQTWMAENLNYDVGDANSYCYDADYCAKYGRLYSWFAAVGACPSGWHLPNDDEWDTLFSAVGGRYIAGAQLKSTCGWLQSVCPNGTDEFGFAVLPAGNYGPHILLDGAPGGFSFDGVGDYAVFWSSTAYCWNFFYDEKWVVQNSSGKNDGHSVRCLKNSN